MKIGIIVDGTAEAHALHEITSRVSSEAQILRPLYADMQPSAPPAQIARAALSRINILNAQGVNQIIILLDRERNPVCPPNLAISIGSAFSSHFGAGVKIDIVVKNCCFENWLVADPNAFQSMPARYRITRAFKQAVKPNKADNIPNPCRLINNIALKSEYHKGNDSKKLAKELNIDEVAKNSRSFRRFLRQLRHPDYIAQSKMPVR